MDTLRQYLVTSGTTQIEFAKAIGVSQPTVSDWLNGRMRPSIARLDAIATVTGIPFRRLVDDLRESVQ